jgi:phthiodiolone/phenolphthiodiolone dimycocerosates ketoreductase
VWDRQFTWLAAGRSSPHECFDYQTLLGYLAARAGGLRLGVGVTEPVRRHPVLLAQALVTLAHLTSRPPILGLGAGERKNTEPYGLRLSQSVSRLEEALQIIRRCLAGRGDLDFHGTHYQLDGAVMDLRPPAGRTPLIWIAAHGPRMLRLTGQYGDGWYPTILEPPAEYAAKLRTIRASAAEAGRDPATITAALAPILVVAPTERAAAAMLDTRFIRFLGLLMPAAAWQRVGARHPLGERFGGYVDFVPETYDRATIETALGAVPREVVAESILWGTPAQIVHRLRAYGDIGLRYVAPVLASMAISPGAALYSAWALGQIAAALNGGR